MTTEADVVDPRNIRVSRSGRPLVVAAVRLAADAPRYNGHGHGRTLVKRSLIVELRKELDLLGLGDDWRTLHDIVRAEERQPRNASRQS